MPSRRFTVYQRVGWPCTISCCSEAWSVRSALVRGVGIAELFSPGVIGGGKSPSVARNLLGIHPYRACGRLSGAYSIETAFPAPPQPALFARSVSLRLDRPAGIAFEGDHGVVEQHRHERRDEAALENEGGVVGEQARDDYLAQALRRHGRADGGGPDIDYQGKPDSLKNQWHSQRKLD